MSTTTKLITAEEFFALPGSRHQEFVRGEVVDVMPPRGVHGVVAALLAALLIQWSKQGVGGRVGVESGFVVEAGPYTDAGSAAVLEIYPRTRELIAHSPDGLARAYGAGVTLEMPDLLPGLALAVSDIFA